MGNYVAKRIKGSGPLADTRGTLPYFKHKTWQNISHRCINTKCKKDWNNRSKRHYLNKKVELLMTKEDFYQWCDGQWDRIKSIYDMGLTPSIDRINDEVGYEIGNIQILTRGENSSKANEKRFGKTKPLIGTNIKTGEKIIFNSNNEASKNGFDYNSIRKCILKQEGRTQHKGYRWENE